MRTGSGQLGIVLVDLGRLGGGVQGRLRRACRDNHCHRRT